MKAIGGFLGLELPAACGALHAEARALASGRACWHAVLEHLRPRRALVPFFVCDAVVEPLGAMGVECAFYSIGANWLPEFDSDRRDDDVVLLVNYFGLLSADMRGLVERDPFRTVVDDTQAFFRKGHATHWSFNSARKFFGVPDGGYLYGPVTPSLHCPPSRTGDADHLLRRLVGDNDEALRQYRAHEMRIDIEIRAMSPLSDRLLASVDMAKVRAARRSNFKAVHERLGPRNRAAVALGDLPADVPMCYPFLPDAPLAREALWRKQLFVPQFWPEVIARAPEGFAHERMLARDLLPLPIDQRYGVEDMMVVCDRVLDVLGR